MRMIIILMLGVQIGIILATAYAIMFGPPRARNPRRPMWTSLALSLIIISSVSFNIAERHVGEEGADLLQFGAPLLLGMGLVTIFMLVRQRRGLDAVP